MLCHQRLRQPAFVPGIDHVQPTVHNFMAAVKPQGRQSITQLFAI